MWCDPRNSPHGAKYEIWVIICIPGYVYMNYLPFNYPLFRTFYLGLLWYWYQKLLMLKCCPKQRKTLELCFNFLFAVLLCGTCDRFSQITSQIMIVITIFSFCDSVLPFILHFISLALHAFWKPVSFAPVDCQQKQSTIRFFLCSVL